ncbi:MAG: hypothetical protein RRZ83_06935 [Alistipes sp.]
MNKKLTFAALALLGLTTACSSVKNAPKSDSKSEKEMIRPIVMYGVRLPQPQPEQEIKDSLKAAPAAEIDAEVKTEVKK